MNIPDWTTPGIYGAFVGAAALAIVGFSWGGWVTGGTAEKVGAERAKAEVVAALVPICVAQFNGDPNGSVALVDLEAASSYKQRDMVMAEGWATMPGSSDPNRDVAMACMKQLSGTF